MPLPRMLAIRQRLEGGGVEDVAAAVSGALEALDLAARLRPGVTVALTVGSRGIADLRGIVAAACGHLRSAGAVPVVVPAMGSHGGATAEGQRDVLAGLGISEAGVGAEIRSSMETAVVGETPQGMPIHADRRALEADHVLVLNRVKPHTHLDGELQSGLHKMALVGLGDHEGARMVHRALQDHPFDDLARAALPILAREYGMLGGLAIVETGRDETGLVEGIAPEDFHARELELLRKAHAWMPRLPVDRIDLLIVDRIGKDISGTGMDTNVVGRKFDDHAATARDAVACKRIYVRGLTEATRGNACGIGLAELTSRRAVDAMDRQATAVNCLTAGHPSGAMIPVTFESDREALEAALSTVGLTPGSRTRVVRIRDTRHLEELWVSEAVAAELAAREDVELLGAPAPMRFDGRGDLID